MQIVISALQKQWLNAIGGRNESFLHQDGDGRYFIYLSLAGGGEGRYLLPEDKDIKFPIDTIK